MIRFRAHWELRNLGLVTEEIRLEDDDMSMTISELREAIAEDADYEFRVVKLPSGFMEAYELLATLGFHFVECQIKMTLALNDWQADSDAMVGVVSLGTPREIQMIKAAIRAGIFQNDRISLSPRFGLHIGGLRMSNWLDDELQRGAKLYTVSRRSSIVGFFVLRKEGNNPVVIFSGLLDPKGSSPLSGQLLINSLHSYIKSCGFLRFDAFVSSNNLAALRLNLSQGMVIGEVMTVFHKFVGSEVSSYD